MGIHTPIKTIDVCMSTYKYKTICNEIILTIANPNRHKTYFVIGFDEY